MDLDKSDQEIKHVLSILSNVDTRIEDPFQEQSSDNSFVPSTPTPPPPATVSSPSTTPSSSNQNVPQLPQFIQALSPPTQPQPDQVDPQILEALRSKDRIFVLKLGETFEALIKESRPRVELTPNSSYHRLLVHRCSAYYKLVPESDPHTKGIAVVCTSESRIPDRRLCDLIPPEPHTHPAIQIMRRPRSLASSVAGEEADLSDVEPSESGSLGGRSNPTSSSASNTNTTANKKHMTIEEREAAYKMARERIFMDFQEKPEKGKGKDGEGVGAVSASLSMLSLNSAPGGGSTSASASSTSAGGRSSLLGDNDDTASSPATESEWSGPAAGTQSRGEHHGNKRESGRRGGPGSTSASSSRSLRNDRGFHGSGSGSSSRNSRAPSPSSSFAYPTLYEPPPPAGQIYDPNQHHQHQAAANAAAAAMGYMNPPGPYPAAYQYASAPGHSQPYMAPTAYPYYSQPYHAYPMHHLPPPQGQQPHPGAGDHTSPGSEPYSPPHQHQHPMNYGHHYVWGQPAPPHPPTMQSPPPPSHVHTITHHHVHPGHAQTHQQNHSTSSAHSMGPPPPPPGPPPSQQPPNPAGAYPGYPAYGYPAQPMTMNGYYSHPPPAGAPQQVPVGSVPPGPASAPQQGQQHGYMDPRGMSGHAPQGHSTNPGQHNPSASVQGQNQRNGYASQNGSMNGGRTSSRSTSNGGGGGGVSKSRSGAPNSTRAPWSYGPNVGGGPVGQSGHGGGYGYGASGGSDTNLGPRFTASHRRPSGNSSSGNSRGSSHFDDTLSISSTSTSSSSTSTNTLVSTSSSQHPLPQRPDWAVGLKAQPNLAGGRHIAGGMSSSPMRTNSHNSTASSTSSNGSRHGSNHASPMPPASTDFPPLTTGPGAIGEKKVPVPTGAWGAPRNGILGLNGVQVDGERASGKNGDTISPKIVRRPGGPHSPNGGQGGQGYHAQSQQGHSPQQEYNSNSFAEVDENEVDTAQMSTPVVASTSPAEASLPSAS